MNMMIWANRKATLFRPMPMTRTSNIKERQRYAKEAINSVTCAKMNSPSMKASLASAKQLRQARHAATESVKAQAKKPFLQTPRLR
mmetsp:Transcript_8905/g.14444  ORF Transcript_8905/g.14444 Transcript_8905/m.14444 type:complete len:86 (-) Transcript_8905:689-946(-)